MDQAFFDKISADASLGMSIFYNKNRRTFLTLSRRRAIIIASNFEKLPRAWFCSDQRQISAENRTAHAVHCQKEIFEFFSKMNNL
jgi:hypothetical protein